MRCVSAFLCLIVGVNPERGGDTHLKNAAVTKSLTSRTI